MTFSAQKVYHYDVVCNQISVGRDGKVSKKESILAPLNRLVIEKWRNDPHEDLDWWTPEHTKVAKMSIYDGKKNLFTPQFLALPDVGFMFPTEIVEDEGAGYVFFNLVKRNSSSVSSR